ncbi:ROK family protein [Maritalea sp.]|uniref:ROK family protein n=1 Tax=Maritalea sp. TaxID=2003361 RepID=UPI003EF7061F
MAKQPINKTLLNNLEFTDHQRRMLAMVLRTPGIRRNELADMLGLSQQTMMRAINPMVEAGILTEIDELAGTRGKPPRLLSYNGGSLVTLGVTLAADRVIVEFSDLYGASVSRQAVIRDFSSASTQLAVLFDAIEEASQSLSSRNFIVGGVVVVQGYFLERGRKIVAYSDPDGWSNIDLCKEFQNRLNVDVTIVNDGKAFAGSMLAKSVSSNFMGILIGTGIGGGIVSDGQLITGAYGNAGEIGRYFEEGPSRPTELTLKRCLDIGHWSEWSGIDTLTDIQRRDLEIWQDNAAEKYGSAINLALALLDFDTVYLGSRIPQDLLSGLVARIKLEPLGFDLRGVDATRFISNPPKIIAQHIDKLSNLANKMAVEQFVSPMPDVSKISNNSEQKMGLV